ncbi:hypothetical protein D3C77_211680 [compost metagenome]
MHRAQLITHFRIQHQQAEQAATTLEPVAPGQLAQLGVGVVHQQVEVVALGNLAEGVAGGRADQGVEPCPALPLAVGTGDLIGQGLVRQLPALVFGLGGTQFGAALFAGRQLQLQAGEVLFQRFAGEFGIALGLVLIQALLALLQQGTGLFDGFFCVLQPLAQLRHGVVVEGQ